MDTAGYRPPSNVKPALLVVGLALIYPSLLARRVFSEPEGIYALDIKWSLLWFIIYILQLTFYTIPFFATPLNALPRTADEKLFTGGLGKLIRRGEGITELTRKVPNNGLIYVRGLLHFTHSVVLTSPQALQEVLNTRSYDFEKPRGARRFLTRVLGTGLIVAEGATHKWQRKAVGPAFQQRHIRDLVPLFWAKAQQMVDGIASGKAVGSDRMNRDQKAFKGVRVNDQGQKETEVEIGGLASRATLDIIGKAGFGRDFNTVVNSDDELAKQYDIILDPQKGKNAKVIMLYMAVNVLLPRWLARQVPWKMNQRVNQAAYRLRGICRDLINDKKAMLKQKKGQDPEKASTEVDILSVLLRKEEIDDDGLVNQMLTFLAAGHETTSSALTWCTYLLSANPGVQDKLRAELAASPLASSPDSISAETIDSLPYLSAVCAETLRVYPTVPVTARTTVHTTRILDQVIPKGTEIVISPWAINRHPELWGPEADDFRPERWLGSSSSTTEKPDISTRDGERGMTSYEFITFLHGPRSCIGQGFARSELKCLLAALVLRFRMELAIPGEVPVPTGAVTIKPRDGMRLRLVEVDS